MTESTVRIDGTTALDRLAGGDCPTCSGTLERGIFDGTVAVVCVDCATPAARLWNARSE